MSIIRIQVTCVSIPGLFLKWSQGHWWWPCSGLYSSLLGKIMKTRDQPTCSMTELLQTSERPLLGSDTVCTMHSIAWLSHARRAGPSDNCWHSLPTSYCNHASYFLPNLKLDAWFCFQDPPLCLPGSSLQAWSSTVQNALFLEKFRTNFEFQLLDLVTVGVFAISLNSLDT